jgi:D-amino peptidase
MRPNVFLIVASLVLAMFAAPAAEAQPRKLKIHISVDMEGVAGAVTGEQLGPQGFEYARFREFMTAEALAAVEAALEAGATEIVVADSHGNGQNLLIEKFPKGVTIVRSWPRPLGMMQGIDETFDGAIFIGYHASIHVPEGVRAHTYSSARFAALRLNGLPVSEAHLSAAIAGHFGVPVLLVAGDDVTVREAREQLGNIEGAVVKWAYGYHSARTLTPQDAQDLIREKTRRAIARLGEFKPYRIAAPVTMDLQLRNYRPAEVLAFLPGVERTGSHSIRFVAKDIPELARFIQFITNYDASLEP